MGSKAARPLTMRPRGWPENSVESSGNVIAHGDARDGKWRGNLRMNCVANTLHTTSEHGVSSITTADAHTSAASSRLNWRPPPIKWKRPFRLKTKSGFCACAITFQTQSHYRSTPLRDLHLSFLTPNPSNSTLLVISVSAVISICLTLDILSMSILSLCQLQDLSGRTRRKDRTHSGG